jgi:hypothetical protein
VMTVVMKNWEPLVSLPALAMPKLGEFIDLVIQRVPSWIAYSGDPSWSGGA